ncbi:MAG: carboxylate-amine ligase [Beijerinckiaceae bacterium]
MLDYFRFGIEEEYFVSNKATRLTPRNVPKRFHNDLSRVLPDALRAEMLQSQIEVATPPSHDMGAAKELLAGYRRLLAAVGDDHDLLVSASGTHPLARWDIQRANNKTRYNLLMHELQMLGARNIVCGLHVHVSVPDPAGRVELMRRLTPYLPFFLALSTSSPYWQARRTGLMGYRLAAYDELPRTGIPELFRDHADYQSYVDALVQSRAIPDESYIWWAIRPSAKYPTLELRIADSCTRVEHTIAIAALYRCLVRHLVREEALNRDIGAADRAIAVENKWIAQRHGIHGAFIDAATKTVRPLADIIAEMIDMVMPDAVALDCVAELETARDILSFGTSADQQIALETDARGRGLTNEEALRSVVDWLATTTRGLGSPAVPTIH